MKERYSVVFRPYEDDVKFVAGLKSQLREKIDWFHSVNSEAHVTNFEFEADEVELIAAIKFFEKVKTGLQSGTVLFGHIDSYPTTLYIGAEVESRIFLKSVMKHIRKSFPLRKEKVSNDPHISIARRLDNERIQVGLELFKEIDVNVSFICDRFFLRKFNGKQFDVIAVFEFGNSEILSRETMQLDLFE